jgi:hypothetical protein
MSEQFTFPFEGTEERGPLTITTEVEHVEDGELGTPDGHMAGCVVVTVTHAKHGAIGDAWTMNYHDLGEQVQGVLIEEPLDYDDILQHIESAKDEALNAAREWLKAEIEAIQSGKREAELFAAVTALNTPSNQPQLL